MPNRTHNYTVDLEWIGNRGTGTSDYRSYGRAHVVTAGTKPELHGSSDPAFRGDADRWSPEDLLVVALSQCHLLWYLDLASHAGVIVQQYVDRPVGTMIETADGAGQFDIVTLRPHVTVADAGMLTRAEQLHDEVHAKCFIARSVNFTVAHEATHAVLAR
jgi:organic hydroperoxide reductase OsmC/OhrA